MSLRPSRKISEEILFTNNWWSYKRDAYELPSGKQGEYHYVDSRGSAMVIPLHEDGSITLVRQYRYLNERESVEFACGGVQEGRTHEEMAALELAEEAGLRADALECIGEFNPFNGATNEICRVFLATQLHAVAAHPDETEEFEILRVTQETVHAWIREKIIWDGMSLAAWMIFLNRT